MYQYKSGSQKRKEAQIKDAETMRNQPSITAFLNIPPPRPIREESEEILAQSEEMEVVTEETRVETGEMPASTEEMDVETVEMPTPTAEMPTPTAEIPTPTAEMPVSVEESPIPLLEIPPPYAETLTEFVQMPESIDDATVNEVDSAIIRQVPINKSHFTSADIQHLVQQGPDDFPKNLPSDFEGRAFPRNLLNLCLNNGEKITRNWLVWSCALNALYCFPCRIFGNYQNESIVSSLAKPCGYTTDLKWQKLYAKIPEHEQSAKHKELHIKWKDFERSIRAGTTIENQMLSQIKELEREWRHIFRCIIEVVLFLGERELGFRGDTELIGNANNGNFLGILELIGRHDPILNAHLQKVKKSQEEGKRMQAHYLSHESQNEFLACCANLVTKAILDERSQSKYYSFITDSTPDCSHQEQTVFILRYVCKTDNNIFEIKERLLEFLNFSVKTGEGIATELKSTLQKHNIPLADCRGYGSDNAANMSGRFKGVQSILKQDNALATHAPCGAHSLNLIGNEAAECCTAAVNFFANVQRFYVLFSSSPQRWEMLKENIPSSLHNLSATRWSARSEAVRPFVRHLPGLKDALNQLLNLSLTAETRSDVLSSLKYLDSFECILMSNIWHTILSLINERNIILQTANITLDKEEEILDSLCEELQKLRDKWDDILSECKLVANNLNIVNQLPSKRPRRGDVTVDPEELFKIDVFLKIIDSILGCMVWRFEKIKVITSEFNIIWTFIDLSDTEIEEKAKYLYNKYGSDLSSNLLDEFIHLRNIYKTVFGQDKIYPLDLLNKIYKINLESIFPNVCVVVRIFCSIPVTVASGERSFSLLKRVKSMFRSTMLQGRLNDLGILSMESELAKQLDYDEIINQFASLKARKVFLQK